MNLKLSSSKNKSKSASKESLLDSVKKLQAFVGAHAFIITFVLGSAAIGYSLVKARSYLNPPRDETRYQDEFSKLNYSKIDTTVLERLQKSQDGQSHDVTQSLPNGRKNPFNE